MSYIQTSMPPTYDETYLVDTITYGITKADTGFSVWNSGRMVGEFTDISEARTNIHRQAHLRWAQDLNAAMTRMEELEAIFTRLGDDPFRLGRFEVVCDLALAPSDDTNSEEPEG